MNDQLNAWECASCESRFDWAPVIHLGLAFCCDGCVAGGPCSCSYDESADRAASSDPIVVAWRIGGALPMTAEAKLRLSDERAALLATLDQARAWRHAGVGGTVGSPLQPWPDGDIERREKRVRDIERILERACVPETGSGAAVGQRVVVEFPDGAIERFALVPPGEADSTRDRVSPQSRLGAALLGRRAGEDVWITASPRHVMGRVVEVD